MILPFTQLFAHEVKGADEYILGAMVTGMALILAGILLVVYPPLLSIIVAAFLIFTGIMVISIARFNRRNRRHFQNPTIEFFFRY